MRKVLHFLIFFLTLSITYGQSWTKIQPSSVRNVGEKKIQPKNFLLLSISDSEINKILLQAPLESEGRRSSHTIKVMLADGFLDEFRIVQYSMMEAELAKQFPNFKTYIGTSINKAERSIRIDYTLNGFRAMVSEPGKRTYIDPYQTGDLATRIIYTKDDIDPNSNWRCLAETRISEAEHSADNRFAGDCKLRTLRLAVAATGEYTSFHGGTVAAGQAAIVTAMNRINGVFERDIATRMILVGNNSALVYTNGNTDPYSNANPNALLDQNVTNVNNVIGLGNYDIGHIFCTSDSGVAYRPSICKDWKAGGVTGQVNPTNDPFWIDYVAHEMGHQFGANHTQNNNCNRAATASMEPGSGSTIMGYAGICSPNVQNNSDDHFHAISISEMTSELGQVTCEQVIDIANNAPVMANLQNYTVPKSTFLVLEATATDADGDALTYCWEQMDPEVGPMPPQGGSSAGPLFRSISPTSSGKRYLPNISAIVANSNPTWEVLPSVGRTMNFRATVRDNSAGAGCTDEENLVITVDGSSGPFLASESISGSTRTAGEAFTYTWSVAGTNLSPVNCSNVDILLSTDGGLTYPTTVLANTPNDGTQEITLPSVSTSTARLMIKCADNIFFDINNANFTISGGGEIPGFTMSADPASGTSCNNGSIQYTINTSSIGGFNTPINLAVAGLPNGATITATENPIAPGNSSTITLANFGSNAGNFTISLTGTAGSESESVDYALSLVEAPAAPSLTSPSDNASGQPSEVTFTWAAAANATSYDLQIGTTSGASNSLDQNFTGTSVQVSGFAANTTYFWRVRSKNDCGDSAFTSDRSFTTAGPGTETCNTYMSTDVPKNIGVNDILEYTSTLTIPLNENITDIDVVSVIGTHSYISDLEFILRGPDNTEVTLFSEICGSESNFDVNFDDEASSASLPCPPTDGMSYQPSGSLSAFDTKSANGLWTLRLRDLYIDDSGSLSSWGLKVCYESTASCNLNVTSTNATGPASLMDAIECAEAGNTITINLPSNSVINLANNEVYIEKNLNITSTNPVYIDYQGSGSALRVKTNCILNLENVTLRQVP